MSIRRSVGRVLTRMQEYVGDDDPWYADDDEQRGHARRGGVQFTTVNALEAFCRALTKGHSPEGREPEVVVRAGNNTHRGTAGQVVANLEQEPAQTGRRSFSVAPAGRENELVVGFTNHGPEDSEVRITGPLTRQDFAELKYLVDSHTRPLTRRERRQAVPVLLPVDSRQEYQNEHEQRLRRSSALWGGFAGFATALVALLAERLILS